ncbi:helix-turn-helix domain-containing protein [Epilithonimonas hungarica]|jgi:AraC-type DNA-binding domain-containing proteins|uniref:Helix-turn-helix domain-containing protein n=1 Tax=Epilithonimonas hungarica TaxID=454006 RepID=A0A1G7TYR0_9FLAO|nr:response regulator transcription factor [Epilithonimonas hungarica]SDG39889.1 Helix-turn-helix domain-containing protein [Epilithonimonas hungarica]
MNNPIKVDSISQLHEMLGFGKPVHPLISINDNANMIVGENLLNQHFLFNFYKISFKKTLKGKIGYGQGYYDFDEGGMVFTAPNQLLSTSSDDMEYEGLTLLIHPDFLRNYSLATRIKSFGFFSYSANEALFLSDKEKQMLFSIFDNIKQELNNTIDDFSQDVIISHIEVLLNYSNRFYKRQFITRKAVNNDLLSKIEELLNVYFEKEQGLSKGLPTVDYLATELSLSPRYLSDMLRSLMGQNAQQLIHEKLIEKAKDYLTTTQLSVTEIAYQLGFEHPQSFNKLFKNKTSQTPVQFKQSFYHN